MSGLFLALEGLDGSGKTTQGALLVSWLRCQFGLDVVLCRDPGGTSLGEHLRWILLDHESSDLAPRAEMLLYAASSAQLVEEVINPALDAGKVVVSDRYLLSGIVYQGYAGTVPAEEVCMAGCSATGYLFPDLTILLDVPIDIANARVGNVRDRIECRPDDYRARVRDGYLRAARECHGWAGSSYPAPIVTIDASFDIEFVADRIRSELERSVQFREYLKKT